MAYFIRNKVFFIAFCWLLLGIFTKPSSAQISAIEDTTEFQFWYAATDARSMAMANATIADPMSSNGLYSNPGILPFSNNMSKLAIHYAYNSSLNIFTENLTVTAVENDGKKLLFGATFLHNGPDNVALVEHNQLTFNQLNFDIAYGQKLTPSLSMGFRWNVNYGKTESADSFTANTSFGVIYSPSPIISYGLVYKGTGFQNEWLGSGLSFYQTGQEATQVTTSKLPQRLEIGTSLRFPSLAEHPDFVLSFSNEKLFGEPGLIYRGGLEIYPVKKLRLLGGYYHSSFVQGGRFGFGLILQPLNINYAYTPNNLDQSGRAHLLSISLDI